MSITFNMVIDELLDSKLVFFPLDTSVRFDAVAGPRALAQGFDPSRVLFVYDNRLECERALAANSQVRALYVMEEDEAPPSQLASCGRCLGVRDARGIAYIAQKLQALLQQTQAWVLHLQTLVLEGRGYSDILDASADVIGCPMVMSGVGLQVIAYTHDLLPKERIILDALQRGYFDEDAARHFREEGLSSLWDEIEGLTLVERKTSQRDYPVVFYVFRVEGNYYLHLTVHLSDKNYTEGLRDKLQILVDVIELHVSRNPPSRLLFEDGAASALANCATGRSSLNRRTLAVLSEAGFMEKTSMRLWLVDYGLAAGEGQIAASMALELAGLSQVGVVFALIGPRLAVLESFEIPAAGRERLESRLDAHLKRRGALALRSDRFAGLAEIPFAYGQCCRGLEAAAAFSYAPGCGYSFTQAFADCLLVHGAGALEFAESCAKKGVAAAVLAEDAADGSQDAALLKAYLASGCRVGEAAQALFVHRNTLAYRLARLEKRHGISLASKATQTRLLIELRLLDRLS